MTEPVLYLKLYPANRRNVEVISYSRLVADALSHGQDVIITESLIFDDRKFILRAEDFKDIFSVPPAESPVTADPAVAGDPQ